MSGLLLLCVSLLVAPSWAQEVTQAISGTVTDPSGRFISGAKIAVTNLDIGLVRSAVVDSDGNFEVLNLPLGPYRIVAQATGFGQSVVSRLTLTVGLHAKISIQLQVGKVTEEIKVTSTVPLVETTSGTVADTVSETQMEELPLNSRTFTTFTTLTPGVSVFTSAASSNNATAAQQHQGTVIVSQGQRPGAVAFIEDGVDISDSSSAGVPGTGGGDILGGDAIAEFQVQTHNYKAEFGQDAGAVISYETKGGTNSLHGDAYDYLRNDVLDARNFFDPSQRPPFRRNQFGGSVGGPIKKDRTFFFVNYEGLRQSLTSTQLDFVPDQTIRTAAAGTGVISDPAAIAAIGLNKPDPFGLPLPGYNASANTFTIAPAMIPYLSLYPAPQQEIGKGVAISSVPDLEPIDQNFFVAKVNQRFSDADTLTARYQYMGNHNSFNTGTSAFSYSERQPVPKRSAERGARFFAEGCQRFPFRHQPHENVSRRGRHRPIRSEPVFRSWAGARGYYRFRNRRRLDCLQRRVFRPRRGLQRPFGHLRHHAAGGRQHDLDKRKAHLPVRWADQAV